MKAAIAFTLVLIFSAPASAFDNTRFGANPDSTPENIAPSQSQLKKCFAQFPRDFCRDTASMATSAQFDMILKRLKTELTAYNIQF